MDSPFDRITNLPQNITKHILQFLSLKDTVQTSILSTSWRYKWTLSSRLVLDGVFFYSVSKDFFKKSMLCRTGEGCLDGRRHTFTNIVNNILFNQCEPVHEFVLCFPPMFPHEEDFSHWIRFLSTKLVYDLTLDNFSGYRTLPSCMFSCAGFADHLTHLTLLRFIVPSLSATCSGFPHLITLTFHTTEANKVGILVSKSPLLENLYLKIFDKNGRLNINAPRLQNLLIEGQLFDVSLKETESIKTISLLCKLRHKWDLATELFTRFPFIENLVLTDDFWLAFDISIVEDRCFEHLKSATILISSSCKSVSCGIALELIKKILSSSPILEVMTIEVSVKLSEERKLAQGLLRYRHTTTAEIIFNTYEGHTPVFIPQPPQWSKYTDALYLFLNKGYSAI